LGRQIRQGIANNTKGTAFVVYEDVMDAKQACDKLNGFNFQGRYLVGEFPPDWASRPFFFLWIATFRLTCDDGNQSYTINPRRWPAQKRTSPSGKKI
jgi:RNA recognition motif-containing protein